MNNRVTGKITNNRSINNYFFCHYCLAGYCHQPLSFPACFCAAG
ncbi:hypothetical protein SASC598P14_000470, partial [Snodgrassella alvi SCGC AB-598-P14]